MSTRWIELDGLVNLRDVGGLPTTDGRVTAFGELLRSDNLQDLTATDVVKLADLGLRDVVDLRSAYEAEREGPGPLSATDVRHHRFSLFREWRPGTDVTTQFDADEGLAEAALPWAGLVPEVELADPVAGHYLGYLLDRPDSVIAALRTIAYAPGAVLVHCAAGKDRTGTIVALALSAVGVDRDAVVADYAQTSERIELIIARLLSSSTYADNLRDRSMDSHLARPVAMSTLLDHIDATFGGVGPMLTVNGWSDTDAQALRAKLVS